MGNFSRQTFDQLKHYVSVRLQQGVPIVDADWNELQDIRKFELEAFLKWYVGDGVPFGNDGFAIGVVAADNDFSIADGRCLAKGWEAVNDWAEQQGTEPLLYTSQPLYGNADLADAWDVAELQTLTTPTGNRTDTVYLDIWEREVGSAEDAGIVNPLIGVETSVRTKREWVVRVAENAAVPKPVTGHVHYLLATLSRTAGDTAVSDIADLRNTGLSLASLEDRVDALAISKVDRAGDLVEGDLTVNGRLAAAATTAVTADALSDSTVAKYGVQATASGTKGAKYGLYSVASGDDTNSKYGVYGLGTGNNGSKYGVYGSGVGDGGGIVYGLYGTASGTGGTRYGVKAYVSVDDDNLKFGVHGEVSGSDGDKFGLYGRVTGAGGKKYGVYGYVMEDDVYEKRGVYGSALGTGGHKYGVYGWASGNDGFGKYGLRGEATGTGGTKYGTYGYAYGSDTASKYGLFGEARGTGGTKYGVYGYAWGHDTDEKFAMHGYANGSDGTKYGIDVLANGGGTNYGIYAEAKGGTTNHAGHFVGDVHVEGSIEVTGAVNVAGDVNKAGGTFLIDHVLDPDNKVLRHSFVESPEDLCLYRGKVTLSPSGTATVELPAYFAALTREEEATVLLTPIGKTYRQLSYTWQSEHTRLVIHGEPGAEASYLVLADRDDPVIRLLRKPVEEDKAGAGLEPGRLLHPTAYGRPQEPDKKPRRTLPQPETEDDEALERQAEKEAEASRQAGEIEAEAHRKRREAEVAVENEVIERVRAKASKGKKQKS